MDVPPDARSGSARAADVDRVAHEALEQLLDLPDVCRVGLALTEGGGRRLRFTASDRDPAQGVAWCHIDAYDDVPLTTTVRTGEPVVGGLDDLDDRYAELVARQRSTGVVAIAAVPLVGTGPPAGGLVLFYDAPQGFDDGQRADLQRRASELAARLRRVQAAAPRHGPGLRDQPVGRGVEVSDLDVDAHPSAVGETRRHLRRTLLAWGVDEDVVDTAVLCLSEVVTNAIVHTGAGAELRATLDQGLLTVTVRDRGRHAGDRPLDPTGDRDPADEPDPLRVHGRGLQVLDALADRWGSELDQVGTTVWFVLEA